MTATTWNPIVHLKEAWSNLKTRWGKIAIILFYSFIWITIVRCVWSIVDPGSLGLSCITDSFKGGTSRDLWIAAFNGYNVFAIGFLLYADMGGLHIRNVTMVTGFTIVACYLFLFSTSNALSGLDCMGTTHVQMWIYPIWSTLALIFTIMEAMLGDHGSASEQQPLV